MWLVLNILKHPQFGTHIDASPHSQSDCYRVLSWVQDTTLYFIHSSSTSASVTWAYVGTRSYRKFIDIQGDTGDENSPWPESASELYRPSVRRLSEKLVQTFADRGCRVVSVTDPYGSILRFL
jgi:hypothetical protein